MRLLHRPEEEEDEDEDDGISMTRKMIHECCRKHSLYSIPDLNDVLYLHSEGFPRIKNLDEYTGLKGLWLNNNQISMIENIAHLTQLTSLYLQNNFITDITGLDTLVNLEVLCLSCNYIGKVTGLANLRHLTTFEIDHNSVKTAELLEGILECSSIQILNLTFNQIDDIHVIDILEQMPDLRVLRIESNPIVPKTRNYRRMMITRLKALTYLDDEPVRDVDRRLVAAWNDGGGPEEMEERHRIKRERFDIERQAMKDLRRLQRETLIRNGGSIQDFPELMSSDDERIPRKVVEITAQEAAELAAEDPD
jgi:dynein assembly factor 1